VNTVLADQYVRAHTQAMLAQAARARLVREARDSHRSTRH